MTYPDLPPFDKMHDPHYYQYMVFNPDLNMYLACKDQDIERYNSCPEQDLAADISLDFPSVYHVQAIRYGQTGCTILSVFRRDIDDTEIAEGASFIDPHNNLTVRLTKDDIELKQMLGLAFEANGEIMLDCNFQDRWDTLINYLQNKQIGHQEKSDPDNHSVSYALPSLKHG